MNNSKSKTRIYTLQPVKSRGKPRWGKTKKSFWFKKMKKQLSVKLYALRFFMWFLSILLCIWQVSISLNRYLTEPISTAVAMETNFENYTYPTFVVCPESFLKNSIARETRTKQVSFDFGLWEENNLGNVLFWKKCDEAINKNCFQTTTKRRSINMVEGHCYKFINNNVYRFIAVNDGQSLLLFPSASNVTARLYLSSRIVYKYSMEHETLSDGSWSSIYISMTEFHNVNSYRNPCWSEDNVINCMNLCMDKLLLKTKITCKLPFLNADLPFCSKFMEIYNFYKFHLKTAFMKRHTCDCKRPCKSVIYSTNEKNFPGSKQSFKIATFIITIPKTVVVESLSYPFSSLAAEIFSNVGFFLGISMLTIFDYVVLMLRGINTTLKKLYALN